MSRKRFAPNDPREWISRAKGNLVRAKKIIPGAFLEDLCFDAQQSVEKGLKAVFVKHGLPFPRTHNLARLLTLLTAGGIKVPKYVRKAAPLTRFAVDIRYPGLARPVTAREHRKAVRIATLVLAWAEKQIK